jgi:asparagine synthase (glutamine-hydrolysing)
MLVSDHLLMGNVRLNIIDITGGTQPISDQTGRYWIVFNGEIYNYIELREELEKKGFYFHTRSDTEVLVQLYALYGRDCLQKLNGQFAFAIWDQKTGALFLARDRVGIRPLFYTHWNDTLLFASEIKSFLSFEDLSLQPDPRALQQVFTLWAPLTPHTAFKGVYELPPAHHISLHNGQMRIGKYWDLSFSQTKAWTMDQALENFESLLSDAVRLRLRSDVPVAAYLSGGIDSTATTYFIKSIQPDNLKTFSVGFEDQQYDETNFQAEASRYLNTSHRQFTCRNEDIADHFAKAIWHAEVPVLRTAPVPMYFLSRLVREEGIKVVITGEGADEMLAGYNIFKETMIRQFWSKQPDSTLRPLLLKKLYPYIPYIKNANPALLKMFFGFKLEATSSPFYSHLIRWNNTSRLMHYISPEFLNGSSHYFPDRDILLRLPQDFSSWSPLAKAQWLEIHLFMSGYLLSSQGDRMAMANSVEGRYPFLDHRLIEFCAALPEKYKLNGLTEKHLLKKLMENRIPQQIVKRSKQAYRAPAPFTAGTAASSDQIQYLLSSEKIHQFGIFNTEAVNKLKQKYATGQPVSEIDNMALTGLISSQILYDQFIHSSQKEQKGQLPELHVQKMITR